MGLLNRTLAFPDVAGSVFSKNLSRFEAALGCEEKRLPTSVGVS